QKEVRGSPDDGHRRSPGATRLSRPRGFRIWLYARRSRAPSPRSIRHAWLTDVIRQVHAVSRGIYGIRRVHAELTLGRSITVGHQAVELLMRRAQIQGISGRPKFRRVVGVATAEDRSRASFTPTKPMNSGSLT